MNWKSASPGWKRICNSCAPGCRRKSARRKQFTLRYPSHLAVDIDQDGTSNSLRNVVKRYYGPENTDPARFILELKEAAQGDEPPTSVRRFLDWDEAREMIAGGMAIAGYKPIVEIQFADYAYPAFDQIVSELARLRYRTAGEFHAALTVRGLARSVLDAAAMRLGDDEKAYYTVELQAPLQQGEPQSTANVAGRPITGRAIEVGRHHG